MREVVGKVSLPLFEGGQGSPGCGFRDWVAEGGFEDGDEGGGGGDCEFFAVVCVGHDNLEVLPFQAAGRVADLAVLVEESVIVDGELVS